MTQDGAPESPLSLEDAAARLGHAHTVALRRRGFARFRRRLRALERDLRRGLERVSESAESGDSGSAAGRSSEWLLDNDYLLQAALEHVARSLDRSFHRSLPRLTTGWLQGRTRIYALARAFVERLDGEVEIDKLIVFVTAYQETSGLAIAELWALPIVLRLAVLERISELIPTLWGGGATEEAAEATNGELVNCVGSLRELATQDWRTFFEAVSRVDHALRQDPAQVYGRMDFATRDSYRRVIERLSRATDWRAEEWVAQQALVLARNSDVRAGHGQHVGYWLIGEGRRKLEAAIRYTPSRPTRMGRWLLRNATPVYLGAHLLVTGALLLALCLYALRNGAGAAGIALLAVIATVPVWSLASSLINFVATHSLPPRVLPKLDFEAGIPAEARTLVVVPSLLTGSAEVESLLADLEIRYLANTDANLRFALLTDFVDAPRATMPEDAALLAQAVAGIEQLNRRHGEGDTVPFLLLHRERRWNPSAGCWMGWERKRGKLVELNRLLQDGKETSLRVHAGSRDAMREVKFVITLDADTKLPRTAAARLVGTMAHPMNRPRFDAASGRVTSGYTILQPRIAVDPSSANRTIFSRLLAGDRGLDLYSMAVSDVYQDLFGEGNYAGKGIYDPVAFERSLRGRVPDNALLSHDLFEGVHGRAGLVSDVLVLEDFPPDIVAFANRLHRWVRGDWQLLPWLLRHVPAANGGRVRSSLSALDRWKMIDNLRRSLLSASLLVMLAAGWTWLPGSPLAWTGVTLVIMGVSVVLTGLAGFQRVAFGPARLPALTGAGWSVRRELVSRLLSLAFMPFAALTTCDAIARTLSRLVISRRRLLEWVPAARAAPPADADRHPGTIWPRLAPATVLTCGIAATVAWRDVASGTSALLVAAPFLLLWLASPYLAYVTGRPSRERHEPLTASDERRLRRVARSTWLYFERFVGADGHWLPPDHYQEEPGGEVAHRTSPTDVGMMLLATLSAHDLGYIGPLELTARLHNSFDTLDVLERYWGHFLNWYDTRSLRALEPRYVSTVDSGNLAGCLLAIARGCEEVIDSPYGQTHIRTGLVDTLDLLRRSLGHLEVGTLTAERDRLVDSLEAMRGQILAPAGDVQWAGVLEQLCDSGFREWEGEIVALVERLAGTVEAKQIAELRVSAEVFERSLHTARRDLQALSPWQVFLAAPPGVYVEARDGVALAEAWRRLREVLARRPSLRGIAGVCNDATEVIERLDARLTAQQPEGAAAARVWNRELSQALASARRDAAFLVSELDRVAARADAFFDAMDFTFLFDSRRQIFHIGFNATNARLDPNHYDLLASEARLAGLLAIAKGDAPQSHWLHLGRPFTSVGGSRALVSWGGTAFEYLLPALLMRTPPDTLLGQSCRAAVEAQLDFARRHKIPWGVSESGYHRFDQHRHYQYRAFGVPPLGLALGLGERLVVTPYASALALPFAPREVLRNLTTLERLGMLGRYGLFEAADYGAADSRTPPEPELVRSYMVHHQGMILTAIANQLGDGGTIERFHADPRVASVDPLVYEQIPRGVALATSWRRKRPQAPVTRPARVSPWTVSPDHPCTQVNVLSNGSLSVLLTAGGGGTAWRGKTALTRWSPDPTIDGRGAWIYVRDELTGELWSVGREPAGGEADEDEVLFGPDRVEIRRRERGVSLRMEVVVSPDDDVEIRRIAVLNESPGARRLSLISYAEPVLAPRADDRRHPAFNKLFIEGNFDRQAGALLHRRRPRSGDETPIHLAHAIAERTAEPEWECDRGRFLGRFGSRRAPHALSGLQRRLSGASGATLDPIMSLACELELAPHQEAKVTFLTATASSAAEAKALIAEYRSPARIERAFRRARRRSAQELEALEMAGSEARSACELLSAALHPQASLRPSAGNPTQSRRAILWALGISGDLPIVLAAVASEEQAPFLRPLLQAHGWWRRRGVELDLVLIDDQGGGYTRALRDRIVRMLEKLEGFAAMGVPGGVFVLGADQVSASERQALQAAARVELRADGGPLDQQLAAAAVSQSRLPAFVPMATDPIRDEGTTPVRRPADLLFDNGIGGFTPDGREYVLYLEHGQHPPSPWVNVIANPGFGFLISESGGGYTWCGNGSEHRLTPWANDPVLDTPGEVLYLRDEETAAVWSPTPQPRGDARPYLVRHGAGYTRFEHASHGLEQSTRFFCHPEEPVKIVALRLTNRWNRARRITVTYYAEWVLGATREATAPHIVSEYEADTGAVLARNAFAPPADRPGAVAFLAASKLPHGLTADRTEFLGRRGDPAAPEGLSRIGLSGSLRAGVDPCAALQVHVDLPPGETTEVHFLLGEGRDHEHALELIRALRDPDQMDRAWRRSIERWDELLGAVTVRTPNRAMDVMVNRWLLYQAVSCRLWARTALYQSSGAFGFRDQLQDVLALLTTAPEMTREHILLAARHQFIEGDVLHWWHPPTDAGVRTRCSDDLLWLPFVTAAYVEATGDAAILDEELPFLTGPTLQEGVADHYAEFATSSDTASLYRHCLRAIERGTTHGRHGLPLIGSGDWNDGLNRVGIEGRGESVWLGWFLHAVLDRFAAVCDGRGDGVEANRLRRRAETLRAAIEDAAWDGDWYLRAFFDDDTPLGSSQSPECRIDAVSQAWAVLSGAGDPARAARAMASVDQQLVRDDDRLVLLLTPPFDQAPWDPGYIKGYPPGVRENGGQYTHAAIWVAWAFAELGNGDLAKELFDVLNPVNRSSRPSSVERYRVEPYAMAADVYSEPPLVGRGGWTWYTGAASWMYRLAVESLLGLRLRRGRITLDPCIPRSWAHFELEVRRGAAEVVIEVDNPRGVNRGVAGLELNGRPVGGNELPELPPGQHRVRVVLG